MCPALSGRIVRDSDIGPKRPSGKRGAGFLLVSPQELQEHILASDFTQIRQGAGVVGFSHGRLRQWTQVILPAQPTSGRIHAVPALSFAVVPATQQDQPRSSRTKFGE